MRQWQVDLIIQSIALQVDLSFSYAHALVFT